MGNKKKANPVSELELSRKELRKEQRQMKKQARGKFFEAKLNKRKGKLGAKSEHVTKNKLSGSTNYEESEKSSKVPTNISKKSDSPNKSRDLKSTKKAHENMLDKMKNQRKRQLIDANKIEDKEIKFLEKRLKLANKKAVSSSKAFVESGLDYILDVCDSEKVHSALTSEVNFDDSDSDFYEDFALIQNGDILKKANVASKKKIKSVKSSGLDTKKVKKEIPTAKNKMLDSRKAEEDCFSDGTDMMDSNSEKSVSSEYSENAFEEEADLSEDNGNFACDGGTDEEVDNKASPAKPEVWEDIYGRLRDQKGNILKQNDGKYIPPALRHSEGTNEDKKRKELMHKVKGLLNRLALNNIHSIANQIEYLYSNNSRNSMNETLFNLYVDSLITPVLSPERLIIDHTLLIAVLHANIGSEIGAYMLQNFVQKFNLLLLPSQVVENKVLDNLMYLISYLYSFKLFEAVLMYDILSKLATQLTEKNVDLILVALKCVGFSLRKDDPMSMKAFLLNIQKQMNLASDAEDHSRMKYMLEILLSIKNNNVSKLSEFDPEQHEHLKKVLKSVIRSGNSIVSLRIGLEDLLKAEERGRWWIVGSAWNKDGEDILKSKKDIAPREKFSAQLLALARKQKMNTDNRRNLFCILMSAEDYHDAFEKILKLGLKGQQEREIPLVIIHCLLQENNYNPYYAHIADQLCVSNRRHQMSLQCAVWDRFRALEKLSSTQINSLAKFLSQLMVAGSIPLSVLKVVEFTELDKRHIRLLRQTILSIANVEGKDSLVQIFQNIIKSKKLSLFQEALRLFVHQFILRNMPDGELKERVSLIYTLLTGDID